jgi:hypothetical protein
LKNCPPKLKSLRRDIELFSQADVEVVDGPGCQRVGAAIGEPIETGFPLLSIALTPLPTVAMPAGLMTEPVAGGVLGRLK